MNESSEARILSPVLSHDNRGVGYFIGSLLQTDRVVTLRK